MSRVTLILFGFILLLAVQISAEPTQSEIEISGFMDFISSYSQSNNDETNIGLGQAEVDLAKEISPSKTIEVAIAYNSDDSKFELGAAILDIHLFGSSGNSHLTGFQNTHSNLIIGQFDVPFGIDYNSYASIDRKLISAPRVVELTHEGWNDLGFNLNIKNSYGNVSFFIVNGFEASTEVIDEVASLALGVEVIEEVDTSPSNAFGGRLAFNVIPHVELGTSAAIGINADNRSEMSLVGLDLQFGIAGLLLKGEYISHTINRSVQKETNKGYYIQSLYDFDIFFLTSRYGSFQPEEVEWIGQLSIGGGIPLSHGTEIRLESIIHESSANNTTMVQLVTEF